MSHPSEDELTQALAAAGVAHHDYEKVSLQGERDERWLGFYAAYALGRLGDFVTANMLNTWLEEAPAGENWPKSAAAYVVKRMTE